MQSYNTVATCAFFMEIIKVSFFYLQVLKAMARAKSRGFSDVLYLDSANKKNLEEVSSCNIFLVKVPFKFILIGGFLFLFFFNLGVFILNYIFYQSMQGNIISSPATGGTILPGVTRRSIIEIALDHGYQVFFFERRLHVSKKLNGRAQYSTQKQNNREKAPWKPNGSKN